jgi:hypothetical protein
MKHCDSTKLDELNAIGDEIERVFSTEGFYIHRNSNNIAWLPCPVEKGLAVSGCWRNSVRSAGFSR